MPLEEFSRRILHEAIRACRHPAVVGTVLHIANARLHRGRHPNAGSIRLHVPGDLHRADRVVGVLGLPRPGPDVPHEDVVLQVSGRNVCPPSDSMCLFEKELKKFSGRGA